MGYVVFGLDYRGACQEGWEKETNLTYRSALPNTMIELAIEEGGRVTSSRYLHSCSSLRYLDSGFDTFRLVEGQTHILILQILQISDLMSPHLA